MATPSQANISPTTSETKQFLIVKTAVEQSTRGDLTTLQERMRARVAVLNQEAWKGLEQGCKVEFNKGGTTVCGTVDALNKKANAVIFTSDAGKLHMVSHTLVRVVSLSKEEGPPSPVVTDEESVTPLEAARLLSRDEIMKMQEHVRARLEVIERKEFAGIHVGRRVEWSSKGIVQHGIVKKLNRRTATVAADDGRVWRVSPGLLRVSPPKRAEVPGDGDIDDGGAKRAKKHEQ